jgi:hypothetical protein
LTLPYFSVISPRLDQPPVEHGPMKSRYDNQIAKTAQPFLGASDCMEG